MTMSSSMAVVTTKLEGRSSSPAAAYVAKPPPPPPPPPGLSFDHDDNKTTVAGYYYESYNGSSAPPRPPAEHQRHQQQAAAEQEKALDGIVLALRGAASLAAFVAVALVASCRHGDWMEFGRYQEYRYLVGASAVACVYSAAQALRNFRRMRAGRYGSGSGGLLADFAGDQAVAYLLITAASAALPITIRMRSAVINIFTDAITAAIGLAFVAFAALAFSAMLSAFRTRSTDILASV